MNAPALRYGPTQTVVRGHSELLTVDINSINGQPVPNLPGIKYPLPIALYANLELVEVRFITDGFLKGKGLPTFAQASRFLLSLATPEGDLWMDRMPCSRLAGRIGAGVRPGIFVTRNPIFQPRVVDAQQGFIESTVAFPGGQVMLEFVYKQ